MARPSHIYDVIGFRTSKIDQAQFGLIPVDPIATFRIARHLYMGRTSRCLIVVRATVIHLEEIPVAKNRMITTGISLPWSIVDYGDFAWHRLLEL